MTDKAFSVVLARTGRTVAVGVGESILDVVLLEGLDVPNACQQGVCGTCETRVLAGAPDYRDFLLSPTEHAASNTMMICCSRSLTDTLTLDL
jgi:vanillate O-demethylase ferredoxin subunit